MGGSGQRGFNKRRWGQGEGVDRGGEGEGMREEIETLICSGRAISMPWKIPARCRMLNS